MANTGKRYSLKSDFSMAARLLMPIGIAVNFVGGQLATGLSLPFYLDTMGTILVGMLCGPWVGGVVGLATNLLLGLTNATYLPYTVVNVALGITTGLCARNNGFTIWWRWIVSVVLMTLVSVVISAPITLLVFGGVTGSGPSVIISAMMAMGSSVWEAVVGIGSIFTIMDRVISIIATYLAVRIIPPNILEKCSCGSTYIRT